MERNFLNWRNLLSCNPCVKVVMSSLCVTDWFKHVLFERRGLGVASSGLALCGCNTNLYGFRKTYDIWIIVLLIVVWWILHRYLEVPTDTAVSRQIQTDIAAYCACIVYTGYMDYFDISIFFSDTRIIAMKKGYSMSKTNQNVCSLSEFTVLWLNQSNIKITSEKIAPTLFFPFLPWCLCLHMCLISVFIQHFVFLLRWLRPSWPRC